MNFTLNKFYTMVIFSCLHNNENNFNNMYFFYNALCGKKFRFIVIIMLSTHRDMIITGRRRLRRLKRLEKLLLSAILWW